MKQKLIKVGNSYAVTIPKDFVDSLNLTFDQGVRVNVDLENAKVEIDFSSSKQNLEKIIDPEVYTVAKDLLSRYLPAFKELAKR